MSAFCGARSPMTTSPRPALRRRQYLALLQHQTRPHPALRQPAGLSGSCEVRPPQPDLVLCLVVVVLQVLLNPVRKSLRLSRHAGPPGAALPRRPRPPLPLLSRPVAAGVRFGRPGSLTRRRRSGRRSGRRRSSCPRSFTARHPLPSVRSLRISSSARRLRVRHRCRFRPSFHRTFRCLHHCLRCRRRGRRPCPTHSRMAGRLPGAKRHLFLFLFLFLVLLLLFVCFRFFFSLKA